MTGPFTLGKEERLKSRKSIESLFEKGKKISVSFFRVLYSLTDGERKQPVQFGVGVSGKNFKKAVDRNRIKRLTREAYRLQKNPLKDQLTEHKKSMDVFFIYTGKVIPLYAEVHTAMGSIIEKLSAVVVHTK